MLRSRQQIHEDRCRSDDRGFTLIEVMVAMFITAIVMTALIYAVVSSLTTIQQARQRQTATGLATQQLERLRAEPYDSVTQPDGAYPAVAVDYTTTISGTTWFKPPARLISGGVSEVLVINGVSGKTVDQVVDGVTYHVETYVTKAAATTSGSQPFYLTAITKWTSTVSRGQRETVQRSTTFSPAGCLSTATSPFAAPCQAYYTARAGESLSGVSVTNTDSSDQPIEGMDAKLLQLGFAHTSTNLLSEQTVTGTAAATTSSGMTTGSSGSATGGESASVAVDSDPSSVPNQSMSSSTSGHTAAVLSSSGSGGTLSIQPSSGDSGSAVGAIQATSTQCLNADGNGLTTGTTAALLRPCVDSKGQPSGAAATLTYSPPSAPATVLTLGSFAPGGPASRSVAALLSATNSGVCSAATPVDCSHAAASRTLGTASFGILAGSSSTPGFDPAQGLWSVSGLTETAAAEEGTGRLAPKFTRAGILKVFTDNGAGGGSYTSIDLSTFASAAVGATPASQTWALPTTTVAYSGVTIQYSGSVMVQRPRITSSPATRTGSVATDCKTAACTSSVDASGAITARVDVVVKDGAGAEVTKFSVVTDLGGLTVDASYKAAANA